MKSKTLFVWLSCILVLLLVACGGSDSDTTSEGETSSEEVAEEPAEEVADPVVPEDEPIEIVVWGTGSEDEGSVLQAAADAYMEIHPNVTIDVQPISWDDGHAKVLAAATSGSGPDLMTGGLSWGIEFGELGGMLDLRNLGIVDDVEKVVHPGVYGSVVSPNGAVYGVPWDLTVYLNYYRPDVLAEVGIDAPPATWDEMTAAISALQDAGKTGFAMQWGNTQWLQYFNYLYQAGGSLYSAGCSEVAINSPAGVEALNYYASLYNDFGASTDGWPDMEGGLVSEDLGFAYSGSWIAGNFDASYPDVVGKWELAPLAAGPSGNNTAFIGGRVIGIMSYTEQPEASADFIKFIYSEEAANALTKRASELNIFYIPPRTDFADKIDAPADRIEAVKTQLDNAVGPPNCTGWEQSQAEVEGMLQEVIFNGMDAQEALDAAAQIMMDNSDGASGPYTGTKESASAPTMEEVAGGEPVELVVWGTGSEDEGSVLQAAADAYMEVHPNVTVEIQPISWDDGHAKVLAAATSGSGPDLMTGGLSWGIEFGELGGMLDLRDFGIVDDIEKVVHPGVYGSVVSTEGAVYGVPWDLTVYLNYYRPDVLEEVGITTAPETWEEMTAAIEALREAGKTGFAMQWGNTQWLQYFNYLYQAGGSLYSADCSEITINSEAGVEALNFYASLYNDYGASTDGWPDMEGGLVSEDLGFAYSGSWIAGNFDASYPDVAGKWMLAPLAAGPSGNNTAFIGGRVIGIMSYTEAPEVAADFIRFIYTEEAANALTTRASELNIFYIPPRTDFASKIDAPADRIEALQAQLTDAVGPPNCTGWEQSQAEVEGMLQQTIFNGMDAQEALDAAAEIMRENLEG